MQFTSGSLLPKENLGFPEAGPNVSPNIRVVRAEAEAIIRDRNPSKNPRSDVRYCKLYYISARGVLQLSSEFVRAFLFGWHCFLRRVVVGCFDGS